LRSCGRVGDELHPEAGGIVLGWLTRVIVAIALVGIVAFDGLSLAAAHFATIDDADSAADSASSAWLATHNLSDALRAAEDDAAAHDSAVLPASLSIDPDGTAHLQVTHQATTVVMRHLPVLKSWTTITAGGSGKALT
jgi:hypothetical protein